MRPTLSRARTASLLRDAKRRVALVAAVADEKIDNVRRTGAEVLTGGDASCLLHLGGALSRRGTVTDEGRPVRTVHFAELLASTRERPLDVDGPVELSIPGGRRRPAACAAEEAAR